MDEKIKVLYDISLLGDVWRSPSIKTGTSRVSEEILYALNATKQCDLLYCANNNYIYWYFASEYLRQNPRLRTSQTLCESKWLKATNGFTEILGKTKNLNILKFTATVFSIFEKYLVDPKALRDAQIFHAGSYHPFPTQIKNAKHLKKFFFVHDLIPILYPHFEGPAWTATLIHCLEKARHDSWFLCNSHCTKRDLCNYLPQLDPERVFVLPLGASDAFYPCHDRVIMRGVLQEYGINDKPYILSVCTLDPRKNLVHLIRCFRDLVRQEKLDDLRLVLVGRRGKSYNEIIDEAGEIKDRIIITGFVDDDKLASLYCSAIGFVSPSLYEGFSLPTLEAMKCGVPVITSNTSVFPEVVGDAGIMVDPTDKDALCQNILRVYKDEPLRKSMSQKGIERSKLYTWEKCARELISAYRSVLRK